MTFNTLYFVSFLFFVLGVYYTLNYLNLFRIQNYFLIAASYFFYAAWDWRFIFILMWITVVDYFCAIFIARSNGRRRKLFLLVSIISNLGLLGFFKYFNFFEASLLSLFMHVGFAASWPFLNIILPIGISFVVFESMSYTIDVYRRELEPDYHFSSYALFISFFPKLVAGPIIRAKTLLHQIENPRVLTRLGLEQAVWWIAFGYFLKLVIADNLSLKVEAIFAGSDPLKGGDALLGIYAFAMQIFGDFAGYSSIAIGVAALLGFSLPRNFRQPYIVENPQQFWKNWHISLSTWLQDYLYISLGGSRRGSLILYRNLLTTMILGGLWHGASWTYVIWGAYHGVMLTIHRMVTKVFPRRAEIGSLRLWITVAAMFHLTCFGWLLFRAKSIQQVTNFIKEIFTNFTITPDFGRDLLIQLSFTFLTVFGYMSLQKKYGDEFVMDRLSTTGRATAFAACYFGILILGEFGIKQFIYFRF